jgi:hypothetical protein
MNVNGSGGMMSQTQMGSVEIKDYDDTTLGRPKLWYEDNYRLAMKASSKETMASVACAIKGFVQQMTDENAAMANNSMAPAFASTAPLMKTVVTVLGFSHEGEEIHTTSRTAMSEVFPKGAVFQVKIQYDIQVGDGEMAAVAKSARLAVSLNRLLLARLCRYSTIPMSMVTVPLQPKVLVAAQSSKIYLPISSNAPAFE